MPWRKVKTLYRFFERQADARRKKRIAFMFEQNPLEFEQFYEKERLHYYGQFAEIIKNLKKFGLKVSVGEAKIVTRVREKTRHQHLEVEGIAAAGGWIG